MSFESADKGLKKEVSFVQLLLLGVSAQIGSGWLFGVLAAADMAGPGAILSWIIASALIFLISLTYLEIGSMLPRSGGIVRYTYLTHGSLSGWIIGWGYWISVVAIPALEAVATLTYIGGQYPSLHLLTTVDGVDMLSWPNGILAGIGLMIFFFCLNYYGSKLLAEANKWVTIWKIGLPVLTFIALFFIMDSSNFTLYGGFMPEGIPGVLHAIPMTGIVFSLLGFRQALDYGGESKNPQRDVPWATFGSIAIPTLIYTLLQIAFIGALNWSDMGLAPGSWSQLVEGGWGDGPLFHALESANIAAMAALGTFLLIDAAVSPLATGWVYLGTGSRTGYGLSVHRSLPKIFSANNKHGVPWLPLIISALVGCLFFVPAPSWYKLVGFISSAAVLSYIMGGVGLPVMRKTAPQLKRPFKLKGYHFWAPVSFIGAVIILYWSGFQVLLNMFTIVLIGLPVYSAYDARCRGWIGKTASYTTSIAFLVLWLYLAVEGGWVLNTNPLDTPETWSFTTYYTAFVVLLLGYLFALWGFSNKIGRKHINASWWLIFLMIGTLWVSFYGYYGPFGPHGSQPNSDGLIFGFPWGMVAEIVIGLIAYVWGINSGFETEQIKEVVKAEVASYEKE